MFLKSRLARGAIALAVASGLVLTPAVAFAEENPGHGSEDSNQGNSSWWDGLKDLLGGNRGNEPQCVKKVEWSYSVDYATASITLNAEGRKRDNAGDAICDEFNVLASLRTYTGIESEYPQGKPKIFKLPVTALGSFTISIPNWSKTTCASVSFYGMFESEGGFDKMTRMLTDELTERNIRNQPSFVHEALKGKGPSPTYVATPVAGCNVPKAEVVTGEITLENLSCEEGSRNWLSLGAVRGGIWSITDTSGSSRDLAEAGVGYSGPLPEGLPYDEKYTIALRDVEKYDEYAVTPISAEWTPKGSVECQSYNASASAVSTPAGCGTPGGVEFVIENAKPVGEIDYSVGDHRQTFVAEKGSLFPVAPSEANGWIDGVSTIEVPYTIAAPLDPESESCQKDEEDQSILIGGANGETGSNDGVVVVSGGDPSSPEEDSSGFNWPLLWLACGVSAALLLATVLFIRRRRMDQEPPEDRLTTRPQPQPGSPPPSPVPGSSPANRARPRPQPRPDVTRPLPQQGALTGRPAPARPTQPPPVTVWMPVAKEADKPTPPTRVMPTRPTSKEPKVHTITSLPKRP